MLWVAVPGHHKINNLEAVRNMGFSQANIREHSTEPENGFDPRAGLELAGEFAANPDMAVPATPRVTVLLMNAWSKPRPTSRGAPAAVPLTP